MKISKKLKALRKESNLTLRELSEKSGLSISFISDIENERRNPSIEKLNNLATALNISVDEFFKEDDATKNNLLIKENTEPYLNKKDEKDIEKALSNTLYQLEHSQDGLMFDGEPIDEETRELLRISLENSMRIAKQIAKNKFTPKKYKK